MLLIIYSNIQIREQLKTNNNDEPKKVSDKMYVKEWLHENARRPVKVITIKTGKSYFKGPYFFNNISIYSSPCDL